MRGVGLEAAKGVTASSATGMSLSDAVFRLTAPA